ncbi:MAG: type VI secretion system baseplate subunit TssE [Desulfobacter sp.]|nr:MAG: type VI secretion system baseplate subunit TssE [Desulfobacter sp.]
MTNQVNLTASLLDRLLDNDPKSGREPAQFRVISEKQILDAVVRDIENLLNTRCSPIRIPVAFTHLRKSVIRYGIRDFSTENPETSLARQKLCKEIEAAISIFEPRLKRPVVRLETEAQKNRRVYFRISGILVIEPLSEPVSFDTFFDLNRGRYVISK